MSPDLRFPTALLALLLLTTACVPPTTLPSAPPPDEIPRLETQVRAQPDDPALLRSLGAAQRAAGEPEEAAEHLERAAELDPADPPTRFFLALTYEDLGRPGDAITAYRGYLERAGEDASTSTIEARIRVLRRAQLQQAVQESLAREEELRRTPPEANTVAVFPFAFTGADESLRPLGRALAGMLATDLSQTDRLRVLDRMNVQMLLDEMALGESRWVDPSTAARSGHLLGARNIVQGQIEGGLERLALDAAVVTVTDPETGERRPLTVSDQGEELFAMETELALGIYESLGVSLTPEERERVTRRPTESIQALLAYGRGLEAVDEGNFAQAAEHFREAASLDPDFEEATEQAEEAEAEARVADASTDELAERTAAVDATPREVPTVVEPVDITGLSSGPHTIELRNAEPGTYLSVDAVEVNPSP